MPSRLLHLLPLLLAAACSSDVVDPPPGSEPDGGTGPDGGIGPDGGTGPDGSTLPTGFVPLITAEWSMSPGQEGYLCATKTLTETMYVGAIRPLSPTGTHHTVVSLGTPSSPDDPGSPCGPSFGEFYAAGVGTGELVLPEGVGLVAQAGRQAHLNLHLFNTQPDTLSGVSGVEVRLLQPSEVQHEASIRFYGPLSFQIPAGQAYSVTDETTFDAPQTLIAIFPHMHRLGTHFKAEVVQGATTTTLWDEDFQFESQEFAAIPPVTVQPGDVLRTTCTWTNTTAQDVFWGDSSNAEMCFTTLMSY